jgi:excisionase family DNA binding protein
MTNPDPITTAEAAEILGIHKATVIRWIEAGVITNSRKLAGATNTYLLDRAEIEKLAAEKAIA